MASVKYQHARWIRHVAERVLPVDVAEHRLVEEHDAALHPRGAQHGCLEHHNVGAGRGGEDDVAALEVGANVPQTQRGEDLTQLRHGDAFGGSHVDSAQQRHEFVHVYH
jgi:hypothetical protein